MNNNIVIKMTYINIHSQAFLSMTGIIKIYLCNLNT